MDPGTKQSVTTGISAILGALLVPLLAKYGFKLSSDQLYTLAGYLASAGAAVFGLIGHLVGELVHAPTGTRAAPPTAVITPAIKKQAGRATVNLLILLSVSALGLPACATLAKVFTPSSAPYVQVAVDLAVAAAVGSDATTQKANAAKIKSIAQQALAATSSSSTTVAALEGLLNQKLAALNLSPGDLAAAELLTATLAGVLQAEIANSASAGNIAQTTTLDIQTVLSDVVAATAAYGV